MTMLLCDRHPEVWWLATRDDVPDRCNPDDADGRQRHSDRDRIRWARIAEVVQAHGQRLVNGQIVTDSDGDQVFELEIPEDFTTAEADIVSSWFNEATCPKRDPWPSARIEDGRHRLWGCWDASPNAVLPILSPTLQTLGDPCEPEPVHRAYHQDLEQGLPVPTDVLQRSPHMASELERITRSCPIPPCTH